MAKIWDFGDSLGFPLPKEEKTCPGSTNMQNLTQIGITVADMSPHTKKGNDISAKTHNRAFVKITSIAR